MASAVRAGLALALAFSLTLGAAPGVAQTAAGGSGNARAIMSGDRLRITVAESPDLSRLYAVAGDGTIDMELVGRIGVDGLSTPEAAEKIERMLEANYFKRASVSVEVADFVEGSILLLGAFRSPSAVAFKGDELLSLIEVISMAGGLQPNAAGNEVRILRLKPGAGMERQIITVDVKSMMETLDFSKDQFLRPRDIVYVPTLGGGGAAEFLALGEFGSSGFHPHSEGLDVIRAVARAGGISREARMDAARLLRPDGKGQYRVIPLDLSRLFGAADMQMNVPVMAGDIFFVPSAQQSAGGKVYLLGEVNAPGVLSLQMDSGTTLAKTLLAHGGVTKFANMSKVRILREAPGGGKQTLEVDVGRILKTGAFEDDVPLKNDDVIIVPERVLF